MSERDLSVVVFGATGIAGRQVAAYLADRAPATGARWAAAGRVPAKVERVLGEIGVAAPEILAADVDDPASLAAMASRARVVLDLVGPYALYGEPVIEACIEAGAHYVDLTGEIPFVRRMIDAKQERAVAAGVKIVNVSGFEALPADLAVLLAAETAQQRWDEQPAAVDLDVEMTAAPTVRLGPSDLISGGTLQSVALILGEDHAELIADPAALIPEPGAAGRVRSASPIAIAPRFGPRGEVIGPMTPAAFINPAVIHRTAHLVAAEQGRAFEPFRYREGVTVPGPLPLPLRYTGAGLLSGTQAGIRALARARPSVRKRAAALLRGALPGSGFGPTGARLQEWSWHLAVNATTAAGHYVRVDLEADGHPGYLTTATMLGEAGLLLAEDGATPARAGFLTPAAALGSERLDRFGHAGMRFRVSS